MGFSASDKAGVKKKATMFDLQICYEINMKCFNVGLTSLPSLK
jgi:hypothetical protein